MNVSNSTKRDITNFVNGFTNNMPPLCEHHLPEGLPIDANCVVTSKDESHPAVIFEEIVENEIRLQGYTPSMISNGTRKQIEHKLRKIFEHEFYKYADTRSCVKCYDDRQEDEDSLSIRMDVPESYDNISKL